MVALGTHFGENSTERAALVWQVEEETLEGIAIGAGILGTGGGGNPYLGKLHARSVIAAAGPVTIVDPSSVHDDALVVAVGGMGSPTVGIGQQRDAATRRFGPNGVARRRRRWYGPRFPRVANGYVHDPRRLSDPGHLSRPTGHVALFADISDAATLERYARAVTIQMGGAAGYAFPSMSGAELKRTVIPGTMALAARIGDSVLAARSAGRDPVAAALAMAGGARLFTGKITDVARRLVGGFARGELHRDDSGSDQSRSLRIDFQNEHLIARRNDGVVLAVVPDLICLVDADTAEPITTEVVRYGLRVAVLGIPAPLQLRSAAALAVVGPAAFGYADVPYQPLPGTFGGSVVERSVGSRVVPAGRSTRSY